MFQSFNLLQNLGAYQYVSILPVIQVFRVSDCFPHLVFQCLRSPTWDLISRRFSPDCNINGSSILPSFTLKPLFITLGTMLVPILGCEGVCVREAIFEKSANVCRVATTFYELRNMVTIQKMKKKCWIPAPETKFLHSIAFWSHSNFQRITCW